MSSLNFPLMPGIVPRLRLACVLVSLVLTGAALIGYQHFKYIYTLTDEFNAITTAAHSVTSDAVQEIRDRSVRTALLLGIASLVSIAALCATHLLIVERQLNRRFVCLRAATEEVTTKEYTTKLDLEGHDEISWMANTLEAFRSDTAELRHANRELQKFTYIAAHDLRSPLRAIQDLAEWTMEDDDSQLSEDGRENMIMLQRRVDRLNLLLSDLLTYSRVGQEREDIASVSLPQIVHRTTEMLDPDGLFDVGYTGVTQEVLMHVAPLRLVLLNLISNAIKHHDKSQGAIRVSATILNGRLHLTVRDDGPGIEPRYHDRIFGLFQTLRPKDEVEGSGLGLAIIRKLVETYGGSVRLTSDPSTSRGTTFVIDMPISKEEPDDQIIAA